MKIRGHLKLVVLGLALVVGGTACASAESGSVRAPRGAAPTSTTTVATSTTRTPNSVVLAIGDSLMVGANDQLTDAWPGVVIDAEEGRTFKTGIDVLEHRLTDETPDILVVALGTNNGTSADQIARVMQLAGDIEEVIFVNVSVPRAWESSTNDVFLEAVATHPSASLVDWKAESQIEAGLFRSDGYHLSADGIAVWVDLIVAEILD